ncbi:MAG: bifunctional folylpolyglutamate synthase/dihydrofolate synthase [Lachnospiraceae bacterium]|nr:bifunctional folylpolyglutamate synthase/dihydrofolate synthase [Lachnospiraceae bacterium]
MTYEEIVNRLTGTEFFSAFAGLYRMHTMLRHFDNPQDAIPCVHVAGTNGKGSVCAILDSVLRRAGYRVGLFTSPYLTDFRERIRVNGEMISKDDLARIGTMMYEYVDSSYMSANQFELLTILALLYFREQKCDVLVLETGLGGTFDPTNAVAAPICSVITNIGLDHCKVLGDTIAKIAAAKAGIIKRERDVCVYPVVREAEDVITQVALSKNAPIHMVDTDELKQLEPIADFEHFSYRGQEYMLALRGKHQQYNAATACEAIRVLNKNGFYISDADVADGLRIVSWPARLERLCARPAVFLDGGHNPQCIRAVTEYFRGTEYKKENITIIAGMVRDKDYRAMLSDLRDLAGTLYFYRFDNKRAIDDAEVDALCEEFSMTRITNLPDAVDSILSAATGKNVLLITGSLYFSSEAREAVTEHFRRKQERKKNG